MSGASTSCLAFTAADPPFPGAVGVAERIEAAVFRIAFDESADALRSYYAEHVAQTVFVLARSDRRWVGMLRLGVPGPQVSLSLEDAVAPPFAVTGPVRVEPLLDVLTAAVRPGARGRGVFELLLDAAARVGDEHGCARMAAMVDRRLLAYVRFRGLSFTLHSDLHPYYGSPATGFASTPLPELHRWLAAVHAA